MNKHFSIIWGTRQISHQQICQYMGSAIKHFKCLALKPGQRIGLCDDNSVEYAILILALWQMKMVVVPINPRWPDKTVSAYASMVSATHVFKARDMKRFVCFDARHEGVVRQLEALDVEQEVSVVATSGSGGESKAAVHTWGNHYYSAKGSLKLIALGVGDCWLLSLPLFHVSGIGILVRCLMSGAVMAIEADVSRALDRGKITHVSLVPLQLQRLLNDPKNHSVLKGLKCILLGGSAIPASLVERSLKLGLNLYLSYGLTEMSSQVATGKVSMCHCEEPEPPRCHCEERSDEAIFTCIKVLPYRQLKISAEGEILVRGETLFKGYLMGNKIHLPHCHPEPQRGEGSKGVINDQWFPTGDLGRLDEKGCLTVFGRKDNMFISGGENIQPEEIERVLLGLDGVVEALVVPQEDQEFGQRPVAFVRFHADPISEAQLKKCLERDLPRFKVPAAFYPWPEDLMAKGIKISRKDLITRL